VAKERWTILRILKWTQDYLRKRSIPNPRLESEILLCHILGFDRVGLYLNYDMALSQSELDGFRGVIQRRAAGEPLQYITGYQEFWSIRFKVGSSVLIPRPETEILVEEALRLVEEEKWLEPKIAEVGTGCGAIAISIAKSAPSTEIVATEISWEALLLARENAFAQEVASRIDLVQGNLLSFTKSGIGIFHMIVSNPPYIKTEDINTLQPEVRDFEPRRALDGGVDGLDFYHGLLREGSPCLRTGGWLVLEIGEDQDENIIPLINQTGVFEQARIIPDYAGRSRVVMAQKV
jgi:release factor glutamine methyltransferase